MTNNESFDPEVIREIEAYLKRDKDKMGTSPKTVRKYLSEHELRGLMLERVIAQEALLHEVTKRIIPYNQSITTQDELSSLVESTVNLLLSPTVPVGKIDQGVELSKNPEGITMLSMLLDGEAIPSFMSAGNIMLEHYSPIQLEHMPQIKRALDISMRFPFSRLTIGSPAGALIDEQTRIAMEHITSQFPDTRDFAYPNDTDFYFFRNRWGIPLVGKVITRPGILLGQRSLADEKNSSSPFTEALSAITGGDLVLAKIGLLSVKKSVEYV